MSVAQSLQLAFRSENIDLNFSVFILFNIFWLVLIQKSKQTSEFNKHSCILLLNQTLRFYYHLLKINIFVCLLWFEKYLTLSSLLSLL